MLDMSENRTIKKGSTYYINVYLKKLIRFYNFR